MAMFDVAVIGGGVIGCALLRELTGLGYHCVLLEKNDLVSGASSGNSGIVHTGFDADPNTMENQCLMEAQELNRELYPRMGVPLKPLGAIMVAWIEEELQELPSIVIKAHQAGVKDCRQLSVDELRQLEPQLSHDALGAVLVPGEAVIDPHLTPVMLAHVARRAGAQVACDSEVTDGHLQTDGSWKLSTSQGIVHTKCVVNAAGLYGDVTDSISHPSAFRIHPRKGQFAVYGQEAGPLLKHIIFPIPKPNTKGILIFPTVYNNLVVGPTAEEVTERQNAKTDNQTVTNLMMYAHRVLPALKKHKIIGSYAGLRPATENKDYQISVVPHRNWVTVGGIRSTGVSACLAIAKYVGQLMQQKLTVYPSSGPKNVKYGVPYRWTNTGSLVIDGAEYKVSHPLTKFGINNTKAKL